TDWSIPCSGYAATIAQRLLWVGNRPIFDDARISNNNRSDTEDTRQRFAHPPKTPCCLQVDGVRGHPVDSSPIPRYLPCIERGDIRVAAEDAAHAGKLLTHRAPYVRGRALSDRLHVSIRINHRLSISTEVACLFQLFNRNMFGQAGNDSSRVQGERTDPVVAPEAIYFDAEQDVGCLRLSISNPAVICAPLEIDVI